jgi:predicted nucleic acid-binding Zn ribbon protein
MSRDAKPGDRKRPLAPLAEVLAAYLDASGLGKGVERAEVVQRWPELVGPQIAAVTQAESVSEDGVLRVRVATAPWATELSLMTPRILARINAGRKGRISSIRWIAGPLDRTHR